MFIKFKDSFVNMDHILTIFSPDEEHPEGAIIYTKGTAVALAPGEYEALALTLLSSGSIDLSVVASAKDDYRNAASRATWMHVIRTREATAQFDKLFLNKEETNPTPPPSQVKNPQQFDPEPRHAPLPPSITNRPGVFPDQFEDL